jgi:lipopolysaccharide transport system permease protein
LDLLVLATVIIASAVGTFVAAVNVKYRDVRYAVPFLLQLLMFGTPIIYPSSLVPEQWRPLLNLNPLAALIDGYRTALLGGSFNYSALAIAFAVSLFMLLLAALYFRSVERHFADVI